MSNRSINMFEISRRFLRRVSMPNHGVRSYEQVARLEHMSPDAVTRAVSSMALFLGGRLTEIRGNRFVPTELSKRALPLLEELFSLAESQVLKGETLRVALTPGVPALVLATAAGRFFEAWGGAVSLELHAVAHGARELVRAKEVAFGFGLCVEVAEFDDVIDPAVPATLQVTTGHRLAGVGGVVDADHFSVHDRVFFSPLVADKLAALLAKVPPANRTEVDDAQLRGHLVSIHAGIGLEYAHPTSRATDGSVRLPVLGVEPSRLGLWLPRKRNQLSEAAQFLIAAIREAALPPLEVLTGVASGMPVLPPPDEPMTA